ncbi:hypothetical protein SSPO_009780 [Streptomyces antimycoticus]|uniref:Uncharacterized protein n=1 Tax=Streptomyces antimycoticus TaxID=68175 RepID=A0A499UED9_9ACTN|nr:hypothetical protein SSPO_009780 [Streptomyces antimycoticus]
MSRVTPLSADGGKEISIGLPRWLEMLADPGWLKCDSAGRFIVGKVGLVHRTGGPPPRHPALLMERFGSQWFWK